MHRVWCALRRAPCRVPRRAARTACRAPSPFWRGVLLVATRSSAAAKIMWYKHVCHSIMHDSYYSRQYHSRWRGGLGLARRERAQQHRQRADWGAEVTRAPRADETRGRGRGGGGARARIEEVGALRPLARSPPLLRLRMACTAPDHGPCLPRSDPTMLLKNMCAIGAPSPAAPCCPIAPMHVSYRATTTVTRQPTRNSRPPPPRATRCRPAPSVRAALRRA